MLPFTTKFNCLNRTYHIILIFSTNPDHIKAVKAHIILPPTKELHLNFIWLILLHARRPYKLNNPIPSTNTRPKCPLPPKKNPSLVIIPTSRQIQNNKLSNADAGANHDATIQYSIWQRINLPQMFPTRTKTHVKKNICNIGIQITTMITSLKNTCKKT